MQQSLSELAHHAPAPQVWVLYENPAWNVPLVRELKRLNLPVVEYFVQHGWFDPVAPPPEGIYINRMSPSSHTRGHVESVSFMHALLVYLESHGRRVINGSRSFLLEMSKVRQMRALAECGIGTPHTLAAAGLDGVIAASERMTYPCLTKHNQSGKGLMIYRCDTPEQLRDLVSSEKFQWSPDHIILLQEYIKPREPFITRVEIVDGKFLYAIASATAGGFELCPADECELPAVNCPADSSQPAAVGTFSLRAGFADPIVGQYIDLLRRNDIDLAGIEFIEAEDGTKYSFDINCTTNYNSRVEEAHRLNGMGHLARLVEREFFRRCSACGERSRTA
jgi:hypothetical protein